MTADCWRGSVATMCALVVAACSEMGTVPNPLSLGSGRIHLETHAKAASSQLVRNGRPITLLLSDVTDARPASGSRRIGDIRATVIDLSDTSLSLDQDVPATVSKALREQLVADGFAVTTDSRAAHDFAVDVRLKEFKLDIVDMDRLGIGADLTLRDGGGKEPLWAGNVAETGERFAGVAGDSRASIVAYLAKGVTAWAVKASANARDALLKSYPQSISVSERRELPVPQRVGVTTLQEAQAREPAAPTGTAVVVAPSIPMASVSNAPDAAAAGSGTFSIATVPAKAKVYIGDVYFGLSPLKVELPTGVAACRFELDGYKPVTEKVSVRRGETTELEIKFEKR
jgi:hypothetical protein